MQQPAAEAGTRARGGAEDTGDFAALYAALFAPVYGYIHFRVGDHHLAEDLAAQVFERALRKRDTVRHPDRARAWVFAIARRAIADHFRRRRPTAPLEWAEALEHPWADSPEGAALRREDTRRLARALAALPDREREILGLRFAARLTNRDIAAIMRLTEDNVAQIVRRTIARMRRQFAEEDTP